MEKFDVSMMITNMNIRVKYALFVEHDNNWYEVKSKSEYAFWVIQSGTLNIEYNGQIYHLSEGDTFFFYPQVLYHATSVEGCSFWFIHFDVMLGTNYHALHFYPFDGCYVSDELSDKQKRLVNSVSSANEKNPFGEFEIRGSTMCFLAHVMMLRYQREESSINFMRKSDMARLQPVLIYVSNHLSEIIYIHELAEYINMSEKYFITFFKKTMGITPRQYIIQIKMKKALEYLQEQNYSVKEVAGLVGYPDIYSFSKSFKKIYGVAPTKF